MRMKNIYNNYRINLTMSNVYVISDLHLGHKNILKFEPELRFGDNSVEHDHILIERIRSQCSNKRDLLIILGDVCTDIECMEYLLEIPARKWLIRGNHDNFQMGVYNKYFEKIEGFMRYKRFWLSHCPIHPHELRGKVNIHGHVHRNSIRNGYGELDKNYINACVENCGGYPINFQALMNNTFKQIISK